MLNEEDTAYVRSERVKLHNPPQDTDTFIHLIMCNHCESGFGDQTAFLEHCIKW